MMLSVVLATASAGTLTRLIGASSALMDRAEAPHVAQLHVGPYDQAELDAWVEPDAPRWSTTRPSSCSASTAPS
jgi:hypothetical protein